MGANSFCLTIWIMLSALLLHRAEASQNHHQDSLNSFLHDYALHTIQKPRTGNLYEVSPPANFSGVGVSLLRLRAHSLWNNGANISSVEIPPMALPSPFTKRVDIVYQNLGNWSTYYYNVPSYTFIAPVVGLLVYDSTTANLIELELRGETTPITIRFNNISLDQNNVRIQCVRFGEDGNLEFSKVIGESSCEARKQGHFSIVVPTTRKRKKAVVKWWMFGIPVGVVGVMVIIVIGFLCRGSGLREMERMSERSEGLNTIWIGNSRLPYASGIRTQPSLETSYIP